MGYPQVVEWFAGGMLIALCTMWLAHELGMTRRLKLGVAGWVAMWIASVGVSIHALNQAEASLRDVSAEERAEVLTKWLVMFARAQTVSRVTVAAGCLVVFGVWLAAKKRA